MTISSEDSLSGALDVLEEADARNLAWGLTGESLTRAQVASLLAARWTGRDVEDCIDVLIAKDLLVKLPHEWPNRYRTRMAESVRLFAHLRQLLPGKPWQAGSNLVSDYRFLWRPRTFPKRDRGSESVVQALQQRDVDPESVAEVPRVLGARRISTFQFDATTAILAAMQVPEDAGIVIGAGTGSGKTLAFYLPALASLSATSADGGRVVAIYPRNELLKDQLLTAMSETRRLKSAGGRQMSIGAYFGPTPLRVGEQNLSRDGWRKRGSSWVCPFLQCPSVAEGSLCGGDLVWHQPASVREASNWGNLTCQRCGEKVGSGEFLLTRQAMQQDPPDILFTTTEMLNRSLTDGWSRHVFGVGPNAKRKPRLVLLDEIHTYAGTGGAQVAYLLRRWRSMIAAPVAWVGLSATLANASEFFADLCGVPVEGITDIRPDPADMIQRGAEYQLLLRGDPASQSALLSTSIQSLMLLRRILDENGSPPGNPYGTRVFAFLENLDLVNRLYRQLLDAEGRGPFGVPEASKAILAGLRLPDYARRYMTIGDELAWDREGQHWWLPDTLGFGERALTIARTSSQDIGVSATADVVIASSALEVGYDDPRVGGVLQHKTPRDIAQFLQRRGRAGRLQTQRPWTVVVLSDYGRDRLTFQSYESILDPSIPAKNLPLGNQSVRKMQAAMCFMDWASIRLKVELGSRWDVRREWSSPSAAQQQHTQAAVKLLDEVLDGGAAQQDLIRYVQTSLMLTHDEVQSVCWEHPRSLMLEVVPTAFRRLQSDWATTQSGEVCPGTDRIGRTPLVEFVPSALFSDLELPEVQIDPPKEYDKTADTSIGIGMALNELAPGRVTLRWAVQKVKGLWISPPDSGVLALEDGLAGEGTAITELRTPLGMLPLVRPTVVRPTSPPPEVRPTSNGRLNWQLQADLQSPSTAIPRPRGGPLADLAVAVCIHLNSDKGPLRTWRYAYEGSAEVVTPTGRRSVDYTFTWRDQPACIGFASTVDALVVTVNVPQSIEAFDLGNDPERLRQLRADRFNALVRSGLADAGVSDFTAGWVAEVVLSIATRAVLDGSGVDDLRQLNPEAWVQRAEGVIDAVLLVADATELDELPLREAVREVMGQPSTARVIIDCLGVLSEDPQGSWLPWIRRRYLQTFAAAWEAGAQQACADFNVESDALVDIVDCSEYRAQIIISDVSPGGGGLVESLARRIADDPRRFDRLVAVALEPSETEDVDPALRLVLTLLQQSGPVADAAVAFRNAATQRLRYWQILTSLLAEEGVPRTHTNLSALSLRIFRPGSGSDSDDLLRLILRKWDDFDCLAGFAVDQRSACVRLATDPEVVEGVRRVNRVATAEMSTGTIQSVIQSVLWARASARRPEALRVSNRFVSDSTPTERTLVKDLLPEVTARVDVARTEWRDDLASELKSSGTALLFSGDNNLPALSGAIQSLMVAPLELDWLLVYPQIEAVRRDDGRLTVQIVLREAPQ